MADLLTETRIKAARPRLAAYKLRDGKGLHLLITPAGGRLWRLRYRHGGKEKMLSLGAWPECTLAEARKRRNTAREQLEHEVDPSAQRKAAKAAAAGRAGNSFEVIAREWYGKHVGGWAAAHGPRILRRFERDIFPHIGADAIVDVTAPKLLAVIRRIEARGRIETAHRALSNCGQVFRYAVATGRAERDPTADLRDALPPAKGTHFAAVTDPVEVGALLTKIESYTAGTLVVHTALRLAPLVFVRPGELRHAKWADIDLEAAEWRFTTSKTKTPHIVPLSTQAVELLRELHALTGRGVFVFPGARTATRPMSDNAICAALRSIGVPKDVMSAHGFRATARTLLDEVLGIRVEYIEHQLGHAVRDPNGRAYNRVAFLAERKAMMQTWADYLDRLRNPQANVVEMRWPA